MRVLTDQLGRVHTFATTPIRIISLVPSQTELLYDLGLEVSIVGITKFCVHPPHLRSVKKIVGGTKQVDVDKIRLLNPDIIICNKEENTAAIVSELATIAVVWVTDIITLDDNNEMILQFGQLFNRRIEAQKWIDKIGFAYSNFKNFMRDRPYKKTAYFIWRAPYMVAGSDTFINEMLALNHFDNIYGGQGRYPEVVLQEIRHEGDPELLLLSSEPYPFKEQHAFEIGRYTHHAKTVFVDGEMFSWYGSRVFKAFDYFKQLQLRIE